MKIKSLIILFVLIGIINYPNNTEFSEVSNNGSSSKLTNYFTHIPLSNQLDLLKQSKKALKNPQSGVGIYHNISQTTSYNYVDHDIISISGNSNFIATAALENWPGEGNKSDPFIIDGLNITRVVPDFDVLLSIQDTNAYFQISNCFLTNAVFGIELTNVDHGLISNNTITMNSERGILLAESRNNVILNNVFINNSWGGVTIYESANSTLINNTVMGSSYGIHIASSTNSTLINNTVMGSSRGIRIASSTNSTLINNTVMGSSRGIHIASSTNSTLINNTVMGSSRGIRIDSSTNSTLINNTVMGSSSGIHIESSTNSTLINNTINWGTGGDGISLYFSLSIKLTGNKIFNCTDGVWALECAQLIVIGNNISDSNYHGIYLDSSNSHISKNFISNSKWIGISVNSRNNTINNNILKNNGIYFMGNQILDCLQHSVVNNSVNGRVIFYSQDATGGIVPSGVGQVILINCTDMVVTAQELSNASIGMLVIFSQNISIENNIISNNSNDGIVLRNSGNCTISGNKIFNCTNGVWALECVQLIVIGNNISDSNYHGIFLDSSNSHISTNFVSNSKWIGISVNSRNNTINNNILKNNGIYFGGNQILDCLQHSVVNNSVNGRVIFYSQDATGGIVPSGVGQVILINCTDMVVTAQELSNASIGMLVIFSQNISIENNIISNNSNYGIVLRNSGNCTISGNSIVKNGPWGITLSVDSSDNNILWNDFIGNYGSQAIGNYGSQARDNGARNLFSCNYWDDWESPDENSDGIVDQEYFIDGASHNFDARPLTSLNNPPHDLIGLTILFPNGGNTLNGTVGIRWRPVLNSKKDPCSYSFYLSEDNGTSWHYIMRTGQLTPITCDVELIISWTTSTSQNGFNNLIKVVAENSEGIQIEDISDALFSIQNPLSLPPTPLNVRIFFFLVIVLLLIFTLRFYPKKSK